MFKQSTIPLLLVVALAFSPTGSLAWMQQQHRGSFSPATMTTRRDFWKESMITVATISTLSTSMAAPAFAVDDEDKKSADATNPNQVQDEKERKRLEKEEREREKEARRMAEETKKRLAVGRIGQIGAL